MNPPTRSFRAPITCTRDEMEEAHTAFVERYPRFEKTQLLDRLRESDYSRLDALQQIYLDYTGGGLYARSQLQKHMAMLENGVYGNPHSNNPTSLASTNLVEQARAYVLEFFNASPEEYVVIFTPNASGALKLVGEAYPFRPGGHYLLTFDNHNSVNGIREFAWDKGATVTYLPITQPELRIDEQKLAEYLELADDEGDHLFAYPSQSNFTGVQHPLELIARAREKGWDVLVDAAAFVPTNRFDLSHWQPDFVPVSFYKMFGYPTGIGCLLARRPALEKLDRPWYAGGTITISSVQGQGHYLAEDEAGFEDGTINYLGIPAVEIGLRHLAHVGMDKIHDRVSSLTGWLLDELPELRHSNGRRLLHIHGPETLHMRGATVTVTFYDPNGEAIDDLRVEELANRVGISLRTGCFCNPGAGEVAHGLGPETMRSFFQDDHRMSFLELRRAMQERFGKNISAVRISVGLATNFGDVYRFYCFARAFLDRTVQEIGPLEEEYEHIAPLMRDAT